MFWSASGGNNLCQPGPKGDRAPLAQAKWVPGGPRPDLPITAGDRWDSENT